MAMTSRWNPRLGLLLLNQLNQPIGIIALISDYRLGWFAFHQLRRLSDVVALSRHSRSTLVGC